MALRSTSQIKTLLLKAQVARGRRGNLGAWKLWCRNLSTPVLYIYLFTSTLSTHTERATRL